MSNVIYLLQYPTGEWVRRDDSTGGYPERVKSLQNATFWYDKDEVLRYAHICKADGLSLYWFEAKPIKADVSPAEAARARGDKEYLEYMRLAKKYGGVELGKCKFDIPWVGKCKKSVEPGEFYCAEHLKEKCYKCKRQATKGCAHTSQFVCGYPMCDEHNHHSDGG